SFAESIQGKQTVRRRAADECRIDRAAQLAKRSPRRNRHFERPTVVTLIDQQLGGNRFADGQLAQVAMLLEDAQGLTDQLFRALVFAKTLPDHREVADDAGLL